MFTNVITAVEVAGKEHDSRCLAPMVAKTAENFTIREVSADKAYSSKAILKLVDDMGATPFIPFQRNQTGTLGPQSSLFNVTEMTPGPDATAWVRKYHYFAYQRDTFLTHYHKRSNVEPTFSRLKRKFGSSLRSKSEVGQRNEVLCKVIAHNLCCLISAMHELGMKAPRFGMPEAS